MSEATLYRIGQTRAKIPEDADWYAFMRYAFDAMEGSGFLLPVELCEHGFYDEHPIDLTVDEWCPGAEIGGDE